MSERVLVLALILGLGIVAFDDVTRQQHFPPRPSRFIGVALVFSVLAVLAVPAPALAAAFAIAVDLALVLRMTPSGGSPAAALTPSTAPGSHSQIPAMLGSSGVPV